MDGSRYVLPTAAVYASTRATTLNPGNSPDQQDRASSLYQAGALRYGWRRAGDTRELWDRHSGLAQGVARAAWHRQAVAVALGPHRLGCPRPQHQVRAGPPRADQGKPRVTILRIEAPRCRLVDLA